MAQTIVDNAVEPIEQSAFDHDLSPRVLHHACFFQGILFLFNIWRIPRSNVLIVAAVSIGRVMEERGVVQRMAEVELNGEDCGEQPNGPSITDSNRLHIAHCCGM